LLAGKLTLRIADPLSDHPLVVEPAAHSPGAKPKHTP